MRVCIRLSRREESSGSRPALPNFIAARADSPLFWVSVALMLRNDSSLEAITVRSNASTSEREPTIRGFTMTSLLMAISAHVDSVFVGKNLPVAESIAVARIQIVHCDDRSVAEAPCRKRAPVLRHVTESGSYLLRDSFSDLTSGMCFPFKS